MAEQLTSGGWTQAEYATWGRLLKEGRSPDYADAVITGARRRKARKGPSVATLKRWMDEGGCEATDGCWVEPDGTCEHGCESWLLVKGLI